MNLEQMSHRCPSAKKIRVGKAEGYELLFKGTPKNAYATIEPREEATVDVLLWNIEDQDERNLDIYEGYPRLYTKEMIPVQLEDGSRTEAMAYIMNPKMLLGLPSMPYFRTILQGYLENGLDERNLIQAVGNTYVQMTEQEEAMAMKMEM